MFESSAILKIRDFDKVELIILLLTHIYPMHNLNKPIDSANCSVNIRT